MPGLFAVTIQPGRLGTQAELRGGKRLDAFLNHACDVRPRARSHANIDLNLGKTRVRNAAGKELPGLSEWMLPAQDASPVWVRDLIAGCPGRDGEGLVWFNADGSKSSTL